MKLRVLLVTACLALAALAGSEAAAEDVRVTLRDVEPRGGKLLATLQTEAQFLRGQGPYAVALDPPAAKGPVSFVFTGVAPGDYALAVMHDENGDNQMQMQANGQPAEGYAVSNAGMFAGPPTFAVAKFSVAAEPVTLSEAMFYPWVPPAQ